MITDLDKLGYYKVTESSGEKQFYSKIQACIYSTQKNLTQESITWHYNDNVYDAMNWQIEPEESLDQLYEQRARELRAQYDYIILSYSAGSDSHNALMSFIKQGLHVDELIVHMFEKSIGGYANLDKSDTSRGNSQHTDYVFHTLPMLKEISKQIPNTKITIIDQSDDLADFYAESKDESWVLTRTENLGMGNVVKYNYLKTIRKDIDINKSVAIIVGAEKPRVGINRDDSHLYFVLTDKSVNASRGVLDSLSAFDNINLELFYWGSTRTCCKTIIKQSHVIAKWLSANPKYQPFFYKENNTRAMFAVVHERVLRNIIYSTWNNNWFQADKSVRAGWHNDLDIWYHKDNTDKKLTDNTAIWKEGLVYVGKNASTFIDSSINGEVDGLIPFRKSKKITKVKIDETIPINDTLGSIANNDSLLRIAINKVF